MYVGYTINLWGYTIGILYVVDYRVGEMAEWLKAAVC